QVSGGLGAERRPARDRLPRQEQHRPGRSPAGLGSDVPTGPGRPLAASGAHHLGPIGDHDQGQVRDQGRLYDPERAQPRHRQACDPDGRPVLRRRGWKAGHDRSRHSGRRRQRRRVPADDRELPVEVRSLYREPERQEEVDWGALELHDVFKIFRAGDTDVVALRGLDLRVDRRELVAVLGPSGSGKTTLLHLAAGLDQPSAGEVRVDGQSLSRLSEPELAVYRARALALVFQTGNLWPSLTARENVLVSLPPAGREDSEAADDALAHFG